MGKYDQIINMEQPVDLKHPKMSLHNRAAQFAPFDALSGFSGRIYESSRLTDRRPILSEDELSRINEALLYIEEHINERPTVTITYFVSDPTKQGGSYQTLRSSIVKIDQYKKVLYLENDFSIFFSDILELNP